MLDGAYVEAGIHRIAALLFSLPLFERTFTNAKISVKLYWNIINTNNNTTMSGKKGSSAPGQRCPGSRRFLLQNGEQIAEIEQLAFQPRASKAASFTHFLKQLIMGKCVPSLLAYLLWQENP